MILLSNAVSDISILLNIIVNICVWSSNGSYHSVDYRSYVVLWLNYWNFLAYKNIFQYTKKKIPHIINNFKPRLISHHVLNCYWVCLWNQWFNHNTVKCYMSWENQHYHYSLCEQMWRLGPWFTLLYEPIPLDKALFTWYCHISPWKHMLTVFFLFQLENRNNVVASCWNHLGADNSNGISYNIHFLWRDKQIFLRIHTYLKCCNIE